ncbi:MAG: hypothetical protein ACYDHY_17265 [Acidiferrobacterales bacterium]
MDRIESRLDAEKSHGLTTRQLCCLLYRCLPVDLQTGQDWLDEWRLADATAAEFALRRARRYWRTDSDLAARWLHVAMLIFENCDVSDYPPPRGAGAGQGGAA